MKPPSFLRMACDEPFRVLFPVGWLIGISGVMLWPLTFAGIHQFYPNVMHGRMMIEGFMGAFVFGFLATAGPRLTDTARFSIAELGGLLTLLLAAVGLHIGHQTFWGDACFLLLLCGFVTTLGRRFFQKGADLPPPGMVLVGPGFLCAIGGTVGLMLAEKGLLSGPWANFSRVLLYEMWVLFLILGVGSFLIPRILEVPPSAEERRKMPHRRRKMGVALGLGAVLLALAAAEAFRPETVRVVAVGRFAVVGGYLWFHIGLSRGKGRRVTIPRCLNVALLFLLLGLLFPLFRPDLRLAAWHLLFIGGFGLITFTVATRVVLGHCGFDHLFVRRLPFLAGTACFFAAAALLRGGGDFLALYRVNALNVAAWFWMAGAILWGWKVLPKVRFADRE